MHRKHGKFGRLLLKCGREYQTKSNTIDTMESSSEKNGASQSDGEPAVYKWPTSELLDSFKWIQMFDAKHRLHCALNRNATTTTTTNKMYTWRKTMWRVFITWDYGKYSKSIMCTHAEIMIHPTLRSNFEWDAKDVPGSNESLLISPLRPFKIRRKTKPPNEIRNNARPIKSSHKTRP